MFSKIKKNKYLISFFLAILLGLVYTFLFRSGDMGDEGLILEGTQRIMSGQIIYRDFFSLIPPGLYYLLALAWSIFGKYYLVARLLSILIAWLICIFIYLTSRSLLNRWLSALSVLMFAGLFYPTQVILSFHWLALLFILIATWQINHYLKDEKNYHLILSGLSLGLGTFSLHTQPPLVALVIAIFILGQTKRQGPWLLAIKKCLIFSASTLGIFVLLMAPFLLKAGIVPIWNDLIISNFYYYPVIGYIPLHDNLLFYLLGINYFGLVLFLFQKKLFSKQTSLYLAISSIMLLSSLYRFDYHHLAYIYPIFTLTLSFYVIDKFDAQAKNIYKIYLIVCFITWHFFLYLPWINLYINPKNWRATDTKIGQVYLPFLNQSGIAPVLKVLNSIPEKEIFIYPYSAYYYSLADKNNPTRYNIIYGEYLTESAKMEIKNDLLNKQVKYILYPPLESGPEKPEQEFLADFIKENYNEQKIKYDDIENYFYLYTKK